MSTPKDTASNGQKKQKKAKKPRKPKRVIAGREKKHKLVQGIEDLISKSLRITETFISKTSSEYKQLVENLAQSYALRGVRKGVAFGFQDVLASAFGIQSTQINLDEVAERNTNTAVYARAVDLFKRKGFKKDDLLAYYSMLCTDYNNLYAAILDYKWGMNEEDNYTAELDRLNQAFEVDSTTAEANNEEIAENNTNSDTTEENTEPIVEVVEEEKESVVPVASWKDRVESEETEEGSTSESTKRKALIPKCDSLQGSAGDILAPKKQRDPVSYKDVRERRRREREARKASFAASTSAVFEAHKEDGYKRPPAPDPVPATTPESVPANLKVKQKPKKIELEPSDKEAVYERYADMFGRRIERAFEEKLNKVRVNYKYGSLYQGVYSDRFISYVSKYFADDLVDKKDHGKNIPLTARLKEQETRGFGAFGLAFAIAAMEVKFMALLEDKYYVGTNGYREVKDREAVEEREKNRVYLEDKKEEKIVEILGNIAKFSSDEDLLTKIFGGRRGYSRTNVKVGNVKTKVEQSVSQSEYLVDYELDLFGLIFDGMDLGPRNYIADNQDELVDGKVKREIYLTWVKDEYPEKLKVLGEELEIPEEYLDICESLGFDRDLYDESMEDVLEDEVDRYEIWSIGSAIEEIFNMYERLSGDDE